MTNQFVALDSGRPNRKVMAKEKCIHTIYCETRIFIKWKGIFGGGFNNTILGGIFQNFSEIRYII